MSRIYGSLLLLVVFLSAPWRLSAAAGGKLSLPANTGAILDQIYSGHEEQALPDIHRLEQEMPDNPLGYLLEAEAEWWRIWCASAEFKYGMTMARHHEKAPGDQHYLDLTTMAYSLAEAGLRTQNSAEMHLYAAMADALASRLYGLRSEYRATARVGVRARANFQAAVALDSALGDAYSGLGLYNYYVDTLSTLAKVLRFFMGIPGGSKEEGIRQLERGIQEGQLSPPLARFYLALNLENYDQKYDEALQIIGPLVNKYPENPMFLLVRGDLNAKLGHKQLAAESYREAGTFAAQVPEEDCRAKIAQLVRQSLAALHLN